MSSLYMKLNICNATNQPEEEQLFSPTDQQWSITYVSFIIQDLDLTRITELHHGSDRDLKFPACLQVQPDIVALKHIKHRRSVIF